jgi:hypothetical protein
MPDDLASQKRILNLRAAPLRVRIEVMRTRIRQQAGSRWCMQVSVGIVAAVWLGLFAPAPSSADPVHIASGYLHLYTPDYDGEGPSLRADFELIGTSASVRFATASVSFVAGGDLNERPLDGNLKSIGTALSGIGSGWTPTTYIDFDAVSFDFTSPPRPVTCPVFDFDCRVVAPFQLKAQLSGTPYDFDTGAYGEPVALSFFGRGTGVGHFCCSASQPDGFIEALYTFGDAPAQTPEPASLVLAGIGLLGVGLRVHRRSTANSLPQP